MHDEMGIRNESLRIVFNIEWQSVNGKTNGAAALKMVTMNFKGQPQSARFLCSIAGKN